MPVQQKIKTCLWFGDNAEEAVNFYVSVFKDSRILKLVHYGEVGPGRGEVGPGRGEVGPGRPGSFMFGIFELQGQEFIALNGRPDFQFNEASSLFVTCDSQAEVDSLWERLTADGGAPSRCGWLKDKFGVSWQIIPSVLMELMTDKDAAKSGRVMEAMLMMGKLDIARLQRAAEIQ